MNAPTRIRPKLFHAGIGARRRRGRGGGTGRCRLSRRPARGRGHVSVPGWIPLHGYDVCLLLVFRVDDFFNLLLLSDFHCFLFLFNVCPTLPSFLHFMHVLVFVFVPSSFLPPTIHPLSNQPPIYPLALTHAPTPHPHPTHSCTPTP